MNSLSDFDALNATTAQKKRIALMLGMWNAVMDEGYWSSIGRRSDFPMPRGWQTAARQLGLKVGRRMVRK